MDDGQWNEKGRETGWEQGVSPRLFGEREQEAAATELPSVGGRSARQTLRLRRRRAPSPRRSDGRAGVP